MTSLAATNRCGCPPVDPGAVARWTIGGKSSAGCNCGGSCGCAGAGEAATGMTCTSGTAEATQRPGVITPGCMPPRPRYFPGQLVTDADLTAAFDHHRSKQLLANSLLSGWGVYAGFALCIDEATCSVCVGPGVAIDAKGRELVHSSTICIPRPKAREVDGIRNCDPCAELPDEELYLAIVYDDCLDGAKPRYGSACGPSADPGCDFSRVRERARFVWLRNVDSGYWTSGCLADPCGEPRTLPGDECSPVFDGCNETGELLLDACTPCIGIRGGAGVRRYAGALDQRWSLSRNAQLITNEDAMADGVCCLGVATLIDVIAGSAWEPCPGEAVVVLARVAWSGGGNAPQIRVAPVRRRVLSNANLTYLVEWLLEYVLCGKRATNAQVEEGSPPAVGSCAPPCVSEQKLVDDIAAAAIGRGPVSKEADVRTRARVAYSIMVEGKRSYEAFDQESFLQVFAAAHPRAESTERGAALRRFHNLVGRAASQAAVERGVAMLFPKGVPTERRADVENEVFDFLRKREFSELGTAPFPAVISLAAKIQSETLGRGDFPREEAERLSKQFPDARAAAEASELQTMREQLRELQSELGRMKSQAPGGVQPIENNVPAAQPAQADGSAPTKEEKGETNAGASYSPPPPNDPSPPPAIDPDRAPRRRR